MDLGTGWRRGKGVITKGWNEMGDLGLEERTVGREIAKGGKGEAVYSSRRRISGGISLRPAAFRTRVIYFLF